MHGIFFKGNGLFCTFANNHELSLFKKCKILGRRALSLIILACTFQAFISIFSQTDQKDFSRLTPAFLISLWNLNICRKHGNKFKIMKMEVRTDHM